MSQSMVLDPPIYDKRVKEILKGLEEKRSREELAELFGHKTYKTLDIYMRRKNFMWHAREQMYIPKVVKTSPSLVSTKPKTKSEIVLNMMNHPDFDIEIICQKAGFVDHRELAEYMSAKGYTWSSDERCYKRESVTDEIIVETKSTLLTSEGNDAQQCPLPIETNRSENGVLHLQEYLPLLEWLKANQSQLSMIVQPEQEGVIPHYYVPGKASGKTIQMSNALQDIAVSFCEERNIKQRELFEVAIIELLKRCGYSYEISDLLRTY